MLSFSLNGTSHGDILGDSNVKRIGRSKGGGKITFGELLVVCGIDRQSVDPRFLSSIGVGIIHLASLALGRFHLAWSCLLLLGTLQLDLLL